MHAITTESCPRNENNNDNKTNAVQPSSDFFFQDENFPLIYTSGKFQRFSPEPGKKPFVSEELQIEIYERIRRRIEFSNIFSNSFQFTYRVLPQGDSQTYE